MSGILGKLDRLQRSTMFKIVASVLVVLLAVGGIIAYAVDAGRLRESLPIQTVRSDLDAQAEAMLAANPDAAKSDEARRETAKAIRNHAETMANSLNSIIERRLSVGAMAIMTGVGAAVALVIIWLGLSLTFLAAAAGVGAVCGPMWAWGGARWSGLATFVAGAVGLAWAFAALVQGVRILLSPSGPVTAVAQTVVTEAVRMKVSLVFIVMLIVALAGLPGVLDTGSPLRYRVQAMISYGCEGTYWIIAVLVVFLGCATVAFEQRDRIIWQTMTKPVRAWQYVLGKWVGVMLVAGVLLWVSAAGVFGFTEYLRLQPAQGEIEAYVPAPGEAAQAITQDRLILETQVLTARRAMLPAFPELDPRAIEQAVVSRLKRVQQDDPKYEDNETNRKLIRDELHKEIAARWMAIAPGDWAQFVFRGMDYAHQTGAPVTLRFKINAGANTPTDTYKVTFLTNGTPPLVLESRLDQFMSEPLPPIALTAIDNGRGGSEWALVLEVFNGDALSRTTNRETMTFPVGGLEVSYPVSGFRSNYLRAVLMMWLKLGFLAMVAIGSATFLSFSVAALQAFGVMLCAEGARFLTESLQSYGVYDQQDFVWWRVPIVGVAEAVAFLFGFYGRLQPIENLAEGRVVTWLNVGTATVVLGGLSALLGAGGAHIFRRRELATYSGQ